MLTRSTAGKANLQIGIEANQSLSAELTPNQPATVEERPSLSLLPVS